ncbi:transcriptional regulator [Pseudomonas entomophila]|uniref:transcriptional regulator n=1 Tax=Pseudomonas entomophila TaxID=312306 RepID=UPI003EBFFE4C
MTESTEKKYDWDLIEHLLQNIQKGTNQSMTPNTDPQALVDALAAKGRSARDATQLDTQAREYTTLLLERGYLASSSPAGDLQSGGLMLTELGSRLLSAIDSSIPGDDRPRRTLDKQGDALDVEVFKEVTADPQLSNGAI